MLSGHQLSNISYHYGNNVTRVLPYQTHTICHIPFPTSYPGVTSHRPHKPSSACTDVWNILLSLSLSFSLSLCIHLSSFPPSLCLSLYIYQYHNTIFLYIHHFLISFTVSVTFLLMFRFGPLKFTVAFHKKISSFSSSS